ncbi:U6 snRNA phosphodiesterase 1-like isoform X2 [Vanessa cardui]|uniref:U6 snRNA phosphodiesterase 1-like isoform X2 n=1 Tax=Vanessa cardui TaxID=171605 RepID=UPI001F1493C7|nr:U6 snRNA phosphodiesterase 1-like isoform X2 [Vanessa cardui]
MSALAYICDYGSEEETSEDSDKEGFDNLKKVKLPTPNLSGVSVVSSEEHIDDPSLHNGRTRSFPHIRGNWATFIYVEYPNKENLFQIIEKLESLVKSVDESCLVCEDVHISLSKTFVLRYHMIKSFTSTLQNLLSNNNSFVLNFDSVEVYCNEENTRTFIALGVDALSHAYLNNILKQIDSLLDDFKLPTFYESPSFHMSILSVNGNKKELLLKILNNLYDIFIQQKYILKPESINKVNCKSGNKIYQYCLK